MVWVQGHMNRDHADKTKAIVETSMGVKIATNHLYSWRDISTLVRSIGSIINCSQMSFSGASIYDLFTT